MLVNHRKKYGPKNFPPLEEIKLHFGVFEYIESEDEEDDEDDD